MSTNFKRRNNELIKSLEKRMYWEPTKIAAEKKIKDLIDSGLSQREAYIKGMDYLTEILISSKKGVEEIISTRISNNQIKNADQARKAVAGNNFQALFAYFLSKNVIQGNIIGVNVVLRPKKHQLIEKYATIVVGMEVQKPDVDVLIYNDNKDAPIIIYSCKTSLRERAGQTYKWKLLLDFATCKCAHIKHNNDCPIEKYKIKFNKERKIFVGFVTADIYGGEINQPQQRGMFSFFDFSYTSNLNVEIKTGKISYLSSIIKDINFVYNES